MIRLSRAGLLGPLAIAAALLAACASNTLVTSPPGTTTTLILLRHAERTMVGQERGTELSEKGRARAAALPAALEGMEIEEYRRQVGDELKQTEFKRAVKHDLDRRRDLYCTPLEEAAGIRYPPPPETGDATETPRPGPS